MRVQDLYAIGNLDASQSAAAQAGKAPPPEAGVPKSDRSAGAQGAAVAADRVQLSDLTDRLSQTPGAGNPQRAAHLERLAVEVQAGRYRVDAAAVSSSILDEALRGG